MKIKDCKNPLFTKGRVVKKESLDCLNRFPRELVELAFNGYTDGILYGFDISYKDGNLYVSAGAIKYLGEVLLFGEEKIPFSRYGEQILIKIHISSKHITEDFEFFPMEIIVDTRLSVADNEIELGRFCLSKGAELRSTYKGVEDFKTYHNTLDLTNVSYAGMGKATMAPKLLKKFAQDMLVSGNANSLDYSFTFMCINSSLIQKDCILWYLSNRLKEPFTELTNDEICEKLVRILNTRLSGGEATDTGSRRRPSIL